MTAHFFSDQEARGKHRVIARPRLAPRPNLIRMLALVLTTALLLAAAWFGDGLRGRAPQLSEPLTLPPAVIPYAEPIAAPETPAEPLRPTRRRARPALHAAEPAAPADDLVVLSAAELDAISQARDPEALPSAPQNATNRPEPASALEGTTHAEDQSGQSRRRTRRR